MSVDVTAEPIRTETISAQADPVARFLRMAILFVVLGIVCVAAYGVIGGVFSPPAPRTQAEVILARSEAAVRQNKEDGQAWAQLARAQYLTGKKAEAQQSLAQGRKNAKDRSILWVNNQDLDIMIREGKHAEALKKSDAYIKQDGKIRGTEFQKAIAEGLKVPLESQTAENQTSVQLFCLRASAAMYLDKSDVAVKAYDNALLMAPRAADILALRGTAKLETGDTKGAEKDFKQALRYMPDEPTAKRGLEVIAEKKTAK